MVEAEDICFSYQGLSVLRNIHFKLRRGESVALVGQNGAGKTTLIKHLNGLLKPHRGHLKILGQETLRRSVSELSRHVGFVWQNPNDQLFQPTVREEVLTGPKALRSYDPSWCDELFNRFGLVSLLERSPFTLSEGQKKRVSFAAALAVKPELIVLDEPTAGQDEPFRRELANFIVELQREDRTVVLVTHDLEFAAEHANRWLVLADGQIIADGPPEAVMADSRAMTKAGLRSTQRYQLIQALRGLKEDKG
jgi:energy-coupling factor transport system ATP-binding protein